MCGADYGAGSHNPADVSTQKSSRLDKYVDSILRVSTQITAQSIAADLRASIQHGRYRPGDRLPIRADLSARYGVSSQTVARALELLKAEGLVTSLKGSGFYVREQPARHRIARTRLVYRDEIGYYFDRAAEQWRAIQTPTVSKQPAPADVARLLAVEPSTEVVTRDRVLGEPVTGQAFQLATSYLSPTAVTAVPAIARPDTGPGGIYDRLEEEYGPLTWSEVIGARASSHTEAGLLHLPAGTPLLRILRTASTPDGEVVEVNDTRMSAELFEVGPYAIQRHVSAQTPEPD